MIRENDGTLVLPWDCTVEELRDAVLTAQGRARTNRLDGPAATALANLVLEQVARVRAVAEVLGCEPAQLKPAGTWCWTATPPYDGIHTQVHLSGWGWGEPPLRLRIRRGPLTTGGIGFGVVTLHIPAARRQA